MRQFRSEIVILCPGWDDKMEDVMRLNTFGWVLLCYVHNLKENERKQNALTMTAKENIKAFMFNSSNCNWILLLNAVERKSKRNETK